MTEYKMIGGYADPSYMERIGLGRRAVINGFDIDGCVLPSQAFITGKRGARIPTRLDDLYREPTIRELETDQKELYSLFSCGEISSLQYQKEWQLLEDQIKQRRANKNEAAIEDEY